MRRFVPVALAFAAALGPAASAQEGELHLRGNYWRDQNTRVIAPEAVLIKSLPSGTTVDANYLLDAITSASVSAGVTGDQPFTELRNEAGLGVNQRLGDANVGVRYRYSTESDYWAHTAGATFGLDLFQKNLALGAGYFFSHSEAAQRAGPVNYFPAALDRKRDDSQLNSHFGILTASQVLSRWALVEGAYEINYLLGYQANPYRSVRVAGTPIREVVPTERGRHALSAAFRLAPLYKSGSLHHLGLYAKYRFYLDDWGIRSHAPELRAYAGLGPVELRLTGRYYTQNKADFYVDDSPGGAPVTNYANGTGSGTALPDYQNGGVMRASCPAGTGCYTGDSKLSAFSSFFLEGRVEVGLGFALRPSVPITRFVSASRLAVSLGYYWNSNYANVQFGNAWVGGVDIVTPL